MNISKVHNHDHFWVEDCILYETYKTNRGFRFHAVAEVLYPDTDKLTEKDIEIITEQLKDK